LIKFKALFLEVVNSVMPIAIWASKIETKKNEESTKTQTMYLSTDEYGDQ